MKRYLRHWFRRATGSHRDQIRRRIIGTCEDQPASRLDLWDGVGHPRPEAMQELMKDIRRGIKR